MNKNEMFNLLKEKNIDISSIVTKFGNLKRGVKKEELEKLLNILPVEKENTKKAVKPNFDDFLLGISKCKNKQELEKTIQNQVKSLKDYYEISTLSAKLSKYRSAIKDYFSDINDIPENFRNTNKKGDIEHLAVTLSYQFLPREEMEKMIKENKEKSDKKLDNKIAITKEEIESILRIAKQGIYQRDDLYFAIASLELLTGRRFIENAKLLNDMDIISNFKILLKRTELAKKHDDNEEILEMLTLEYSEGIIDCIDWIRDNLDLSELSNEETTNNYLGTVNNRVKRYFSLCKKHESDYPTSHTLRAYSANIAWYFYGSESKDKRKFIEKYLGHDNDLSAKEYDRYYVDSNSFPDHEKQGYKVYLLDDETEINLTLTPSQLFKIQEYGIDNLINSYEEKIKIIEETKTTEETTKTEEKVKKLSHFEILKNCVDTIIKYNEDKEKDDKIAITSRALYELTGKRTPIISDFINNSEYSELIAKYNNDNQFGQKQNMGKDLRKRLGL